MLRRFPRPVTAEIPMEVEDTGVTKQEKFKAPPEDHTVLNFAEWLEDYDDSPNASSDEVSNAAGIDLDSLPSSNFVDASGSDGAPFYNKDHGSDDRTALTATLDCSVTAQEPDMSFSTALTDSEAFFDFQDVVQNSTDTPFYTLCTWNLISAIPPLPDEILALVFERGLASCPNPNGSNRTPLFPVVVSQVCRRWRRIALAQSDIWTHISVTKYHPFLDEYMLRSRWRLVDVHVSCSESIGEVLNAIMPHANRWRRLSIVSAHWGRLEGTLRLLKSVQAMSLRVLEIVGQSLSRGLGEEVEAEGVFPVFGAGAPHLKSIRMQGCFFALYPASAIAVRYLRYGMFGSQARFRQFIFGQLFTPFHALSTLVMDSSTHAVFPPNAPIVLPELRTLVLIGTSPQGVITTTFPVSVLKTLDAQSLTRLVLVSIRPEETQQAIHHMSLFPFKYASVTSLHISAPLSDHFFWNLPRIMPDLTDLTMHLLLGQHFLSSFLPHATAHASAAPWRALATLTLYATCTGAMLAHVVDFARERSAAGLRIARLRLHTGVFRSGLGQDEVVGQLRAAVDVLEFAESHLDIEELAADDS